MNFVFSIGSVRTARRHAIPAGLPPAHRGQPAPHRIDHFRRHLLAPADSVPVNEGAGDQASSHTNSGHSQPLALLSGTAPRPLTFLLTAST